MLVRDRYGGVTAERRPPREHLEEHDAGGVEVGARVDRLALRLLGREVRRGAEDRRGLRDGRRRVGYRAGDAEVHDLHLAGRGDHDVARLDVAVHHSGPVGVLERREHSVDHADGRDGLERPVVDDVLQQPPLDVLHDDEGQLHLVAPGIDHGLLARVEHANDGGVRHSCRGLRLLAESHAERRVGRELRLEELDGDLAAEPRVGPDVHIGHAAATDECTHAVAPREYASFIAHRAAPSTCRPVFPSVPAVAHDSMFTVSAGENGESSWPQK